MNVDVRVQQADFDVATELISLRGDQPEIGAIVSFTGLVRDVNEQSTVSGLYLEHYPGMTERALENIVARAARRWNVLGCRIVHRIGDLAPLDQIVFVAVASMHRGDAFAACEFVMDFLKTEAPFWKRERRANGDQWLDARASDELAAKRWQS